MPYDPAKEVVDKRKVTVEKGTTGWVLKVRKEDSDDFVEDFLHAHATKPMPRKQGFSR
jgi:hypothetical protein